MKKQFLKNIELETVLNLGELVPYQSGQVVSRTLVQNKSVSITLFAFDAGEEISTHESGGDAIVTVLEGEGVITIDGKVYRPQQGQTIVMPAGIPHAVACEQPFKMQLVVVFGQ